MGYKLIVLEGLDRCGKTTVTNILAEKLHPSIVVRFPDRSTETGQLLDKFLKKQIYFSDHVTHLLYSANRYENEGQIRELLKTSHVICDRYWLSGTVYSVAKGLDINWCKNTDKFLPQPDATFFIDLPVEITSQRMKFGTEAHDKVEFQRRVYEIYKSPEIRDELQVIDGMQEPEKIAADILKWLDLLM